MWEGVCSLCRNILSPFSASSASNGICAFFLFQAQARCHRIGQSKAVKVYRLITRNSYEREMFDKASLKLGLDKAVLQDINRKGGNNGVREPHSSQELRTCSYLLFLSKKIFGYQLVEIASIPALFPCAKANLRDHSLVSGRFNSSLRWRLKICCERELMGH